MQSVSSTHPGEAKPGGKPRQVDAHESLHKADCPFEAHEGAAAEVQATMEADKSKKIRILSQLFLLR